MGDNANNKWQWHNTEIGSGYQAKFVVRQPGKSNEEMKIVDMRGPVASEVQNLSKVAHDNKNNPLKREHDDDDDSNDTNDSYKHKSTEKSRKNEIHSKDNKKDKKQKKEKKEKKQKESKHKKSKRSRSHSVSSNDDDDSSKGRQARDGLSTHSVSAYNPLMQLFVSKLSDDGMS